MNYEFNDLTSEFKADLARLVESTHGVKIYDAKIEILESTNGEIFNCKRGDLIMQKEGQHLIPLHIWSLRERAKYYSDPMAFELRSEGHIQFAKDVLELLKGLHRE